MTWVEKHYGRLEDQPGFDGFHHEYSAAIKEVDTKIEILSEDFAVRHDYNPIHHIEKRLKTPQGIEDKLRRLHCDISIPSARENILDIAGIRVVCNFVDDVYEVAKMLTSQNDIKVNSRKDYIENPKPNGYRSLHLIVQVPIFLANEKKLMKVEIQLRTIAMDSWAALEHQLRYKKDSQFTDDMAEELQRCAEISAELDRRMGALKSKLHK